MSSAMSDSEMCLCFYARALLSALWKLPSPLVVLRRVTGCCQLSGPLGWSTPALISLIVPIIPPLSAPFLAPSQPQPPLVYLPLL